MAETKLTAELDGETVRALNRPSDAAALARLARQAIDAEPTGLDRTPAGAAPAGNPADLPHPPADAAPPMPAAAADAAPPADGLPDAPGASTPPTAGEGPPARAGRPPAGSAAVTHNYTSIGNYYARSADELAEGRCDWHEAAELA